MAVIAPYRRRLDPIFNALITQTDFASAQGAQLTILELMRAQRIRRLLTLGHRDPGSPLSKLPMKVLDMIALQ